ncbi:MAG: molybdopterin dinucleotide-binding protein, partial [Akkermansiaceae bacterium]|nr:molybdopterin dinucleotide-binding protein [Akkermansiaceae bacterium]
TAGAHSIEEGDQVRVTSRIGSVVLPVALRDGIRRGSVRIAKGGGHSAWGRFAKGKGANVMELIPLELDPVSGAPVLQGVRVQI